jgi:outer membrane immunogenic protein
MRRGSLTLLAAAIGLAASQASAADLPRRAPAYIPPAPPLITWTGCYIGANIGGAFGNASVTGNGGSGGEVSTNGSGFAGGGQIGCDYQFAGTGWVIGFRNMFDGTSNKRSGTFPGPGPLAGDVVNFNNQWFDTLTGRIGYAVAPTWLLYFQGGGAWAHTSTNITAGGFQIGQTSKTSSGWTVGGGVEWMFAPHWSAFLEGNYMDFGTRNGTVFGVVGCAAGCAYAAKATETTVLVGVNYRFW